MQLFRFMMCILCICSAQHTKVPPKLFVPGQCIIYTNTFLCVHIPLDLIWRKSGRVEMKGGKCRDKSGMRNRREVEEGKPIADFFF